MAKQNQRSEFPLRNIATAVMMHATPRMKKKSAASLYVLGGIVLCMPNGQN
jgi:hypothetical protein